jgi:methylisocitrate lyase
VKDGPHALRTLLAGPIAAAPGAQDVLSARIIAQAGHRAIYLGGNAMALGLGKGQPFLTLTETVEIVHRVTRAVDVPVIVDAGAGFGDPAHLHIAVRELEAAGAAAIHIDDQPYPKQAAYHRGRGSLVTVETMVARLRTALAARSEMLIMARSDALRVTRSHEDAIARARAYIEAGADALIMLDAGPEMVPALREAAPGKPLVWIGGVTPPVPDLAALGDAGFALALYPFNGVAAITTALNDLWGALAETGRIAQSDETLARARTETLVAIDMQTFWDIEDSNP